MVIFDKIGLNSLVGFGLVARDFVPENKVGQAGDRGGDGSEVACRLGCRREGDGHHTTRQTGEGVPTHRRRVSLFG